MKLVVGENASYHVSFETVKDFEQVILNDNAANEWKPHTERSVASQHLFRHLYKMSPSLVHRMVSASGRKRTTLDEIFAVIMGDQYAKCWPAFLHVGKRHIYLFDAWPKYHAKLKKFVTNYQIETLFVSSSQIADQLKELNLPCAIHYLAEGVRASKFKALPLSEKDIDVLHMGRRYEQFHTQIVDGLANAGLSYYYERQPGTLIFPDETGFERGMARSKVSICVPSGVTHPERTGGIMTMTQRYLQTMLVKAIPLGICPPELKELFGYDPVVPFSTTDPVGQLIELVNNPANYAQLIERNYRTVIEKHTWSHRWESVKQILQNQQDQRTTPIGQATQR